jgi:hypothetical protein
LVDRGQLVLERVVEVLDYLFVALHRGLLTSLGWRRYNALAPEKAAKNGGKLRKISCDC